MQNIIRKVEKPAMTIASDLLQIPDLPEALLLPHPRLIQVLPESKVITSRLTLLQYPPGE
ncbi:MAG: hypothetical protein WCZ86_01460 [Desulfurivibrionaceae bacterium]